MQFLAPSDYVLAVPSILHLNHMSMFVFFQPHMKLHNSVAFRLFWYLKEFMSISVARFRLYDRLNHIILPRLFLFFCFCLFINLFIYFIYVFIFFI